MVITTLDWLIIVGSVAICFVPALLFSRRAGKNTAEFFTSGRAAPWWLIGISMVATTFSTDTPNLVTSFVRERGVAGNWSWWAFLLTGMLTVFFYARLWRRSQVLTDLEFYEIRYSGRPASVLRGFRALYLGLFFNCVIMASVNLAAAKIANVLFGWPQWQTLLVCGGINILFAATAGLWGVLVVDLIQFGIAMTGAFAAAYFALAQPEVGGLAGLISRSDPRTLGLLPDFGNWELTLEMLIIPLAVQWWSVWYPGAEPGGGSYIAQRMLAARSERDAVAGTLLFNICHYALRPWPWIIVGMASLLVYPDLASLRHTFPHLNEDLIGHDMAYPAMLRFLPPGWMGLMIAGLLAAYVSTIVTHLNWGSSYVVHDFYRRFVRTDADEHHYVRVSRIVTALLMLLCGALTFVLESARQNFELMLSVGAGTGLIYLLRWFWWRINAWSEIAAMICSFVLAVGWLAIGKLSHLLPTDTLDALVARGWLRATTSGGWQVNPHWSLVLTVLITTAVWLLVTYLTPPTNRQVLIEFYRRVRPAGPGWKAVQAQAAVGPSPDSPALGLLGWIAGCLLVYAALFGGGCLLYGNYGLALVWLAVLISSGMCLWYVLRRMWPAR